MPPIWKMANVTPVFKKGAKTNPSNYRPISLISIVCKVMESLIRDEMMDHLMANNLLNRHQHGFVIGKSCASNLLETLDIITEALNRGFCAVTVFLDFSKAFDSVVHSFLTIKLEAYGFHGKVLNWLTEFLINRKQRVVIGSAHSNWLDVLSGVPQGSVLGPLLFVIFINDLPEQFQNLCKLFADDSKLLAVIRNSSELLSVQEDLDQAVNWSNTWNLGFNLDKCKSMHFGSFKNFQRATFLMDNKSQTRHEIEESSVERDLGVMINSKLKWGDQIDKMILTANGVLASLKNSFKYWTPANFRKLYTTFVRPHLEYCTPAWNPSLKKDISRLERVQRRATKIVPCLKNLDYSARLTAIGITSLKRRRDRGDLIQMFKITSGQNAVSLHALSNIQEREPLDAPSANLRHIKPRLTRQICNVKARENFFTNRIANNWNNLPDSIVYSSSTNNFKNNLDNFWDQQLAGSETAIAD